MAVKLIHSKPPTVNADLVDALKTATARAEAGEVTGGIIALDGPEGTDFSFCTEGECQADSLIGFWERVIKPYMAELYTEG